MKNRILFLVFTVLISTTQQSFGQSEKSNEYLTKANEVYYQSKLDENIKIDSALFLTNQAIKFNEQNINSYLLKSTLLFRKKNLDELINVSDKLISLRPNKPLYLGQKAFYLELKGENEAAKVLFQKAINSYQKYLEVDSLNFNLYIEYIGILESSNNIILYDETIAEMKSMNFTESQKEILDLYQTQHISKAELIKYWNGEISYNDLGEQ
jgi:tetratricopeptide (TPR) repeat protein